MPETIAEDVAWISEARARAALGVSPGTLHKLIEEGRISALRIPGARPRVSRGDVVALIAQSTTYKSVRSGDLPGANR